MGDGAAEDVGAAPGRIRDDDSDGMVGIARGMGRGQRQHGQRGGRQRSPSGARMQELRHGFVS